MREIKFRAWDLINEEMVVNSELETSELIDVFKNEDLEVMQYTGSKDINDVEIYENDILKSDINDIVGVVKFIDGAFVVIWEDIEDDLYDWTGEIIIGNIYENPELLEKIE